MDHDRLPKCNTITKSSWTYTSTSSKYTNEAKSSSRSDARQKILYRLGKLHILHQSLAAAIWHRTRNNHLPSFHTCNIWRALLCGEIHVLLFLPWVLRVAVTALPPSAPLCQRRTLCTRHTWQTFSSSRGGLEAGKSNKKNLNKSKKDTSLSPAKSLPPHADLLRCLHGDKRPCSWTSSPISCPHVDSVTAVDL